MEAILRVNDLSIEIKQRSLMKNISFELREGDVILLSGENGIGKSSLLKSILRLEMEEKKVEGEIGHHKYGNILSLDSNTIQRFRSEVVYIQQKDEYSEMGNIQVRDILSESSNLYSGKGMSSAQVNELIDEWIPRRSDNKRVFDAKSKPGKFSGGEQRLLSVFSALVTRPRTDLMIIDEPLNNLDFNNARNISNLINHVIKENPQVGVLMVSHCRIFPFITREIRLTINGAHEIMNEYICHSCFGEPDENGYY